jgi:hypothetical protein
MTRVLLDATVLAAAFLAGLPVLTLVHELGHALAAAALVGGRVTVVQGPAPARIHVTLWRLDLRLHGPVAPHRTWVGWALWGPHPQRWRHGVATAAGPAASALSSAFCAAGAFGTAGAARLFLVVLALAAACQALTSGVPVRYGRRFGSFGGEASDGLRIRRLIEGRPEPMPSARTEASPLTPPRAAPLG